MKNTLTLRVAQFALAAVSLAAIGQVAHADTANFNCTRTLGGQTVQVVASVNPGHEFQVAVAVDGKDVQAAGRKCFESDRPSTTHVLCAFKTPKFELDIYPWVQTTSGAINMMRYVLWQNGRAVGSGSFLDCASK